MGLYSQSLRRYIGGMRNSNPSREQLESFWRTRLLKRWFYQVAKFEGTKAVPAMVAPEWKSPTPDELLEFRKALQAETMALIEYRRVFKSFNDFSSRWLLGWGCTTPPVWSRRVL